MGGRERPRDPLKPDDIRLGLNIIPPPVRPKMLDPILRCGIGPKCAGVDADHNCSVAFSGVHGKIFDWV